MDKREAGLSPQRNYTPLVVGLSVTINLAVAVLFILQGRREATAPDLTVLPMINAILNSFTFVFLLAGLYFIRRKAIQTHRNFILAAFTSTALFLVTYVVYHGLAESTRYGGESALRYFYYAILLTHVVLAVAVVPLALFSLGSGLTRNVARHRKLARWTMPLWLYVSLSGVIVYLMIRPYY
ncbi:MAG TPA: DUF420 domain-containing protein [Symbiobacteriaceae bacterium]|nr:DUF420 domain-containing protein [Symbiobacteriaceae bacterium]